MTGARELLFGRDVACDVRFDQNRDEFVSRRHMKLVVGDPDRLEFTAIDLGALNGTFVNRRRVTGSAKLQPGDVVQLGAGGPEFTFDVLPEDLKVTPLCGIATVPPPEAPRVESGTPVSTPRPKASNRRSVPNRRRPKHASPQKRTAGMAVLFLVAVAAGWYLMGPHEMPRLGRTGIAARAFIARGSSVFQSFHTPAPEEIAGKNVEFLVTVETDWRLVDSATNRPLKQIYVPNRREISDSSSTALIPNAGRDLPVFVLLAGNRLQPLLTVADQSSYQAIGGRSRGAGFIVASDPLILTSRSVTSPWRAPYEWPSADTAGIVAVFDQQLRLAKTAIIARRQFPRWVPVDTEFVLENDLDQKSVRVNSLIRGKGLSDLLTVRVPTLRLDVLASLVKESDETGFAAIRPEAPMTTRGIAVATEANPKVGDELVMFASVNARPAIGKLADIDPRGRYALAVDPDRTAGAGTPIFDRRGRVVAIQSESDPLRLDRAFAVSIRRALESVGQASARLNTAAAF